jgi:hypothetical protein
MSRSEENVIINRKSLRYSGIFYTTISIILLYFKLEYTAAALFGVGGAFFLLSLAYFSSNKILYDLPRNTIPKRYR